jgi:indolepyruvate ferredoxin oxidoreductase
VAAEGVAKIVVVSDEPDKYPSGYFASDIEVHDRDDLDAVQRKLRETPGCTVLLYDQTCAAEKRRRRKRGKFPVPLRRVVINELVCEAAATAGSSRTACRSRRSRPSTAGKRTIDQSSCNKDFSVREGLLPELRHRRGRHAPEAEKGRRPASFPTCPIPCGRRQRSRTASWSRASAAPAS